ncbi:MAG: LamG-like jellyroll fold domain-containing protein [Pseudomonas sp.]|uniref:LamG-like jellyroll fold domain-containing protein n=1 Tax=Pseudomonas sp. TaxID=306 RepID=UPI0032420A63
MPLLNDADAVYLGASKADRVYLGATLVWGAQPRTDHLLHFDGADGSTAFIDESGMVWTGTGSVQLDIAQKKFGSASLECPSSGGVFSPVDGVNFGAGQDFTLECFFNSNSSASRVLLSVVGDGITWTFFRRSNNILSVYNGEDGTLTTAGLNISNGTWHHAAFCREGSILRVFLNGQLSATITNSRALPEFARVGIASSGYTSQDFGGYMDEVRITPHEALYTSDFTPPEAPFA